MSKRINITLDNYKLDKYKEVLDEAKIKYIEPLPIFPGVLFIVIETTDVNYHTLRLTVDVLTRHVEEHFKKLENDNRRSKEVTQRE